MCPPDAIPEGQWGAVEGSEGKKKKKKKKEELVNFTVTFAIFTEIFYRHQSHLNLGSYDNGRM